MIFFESNKITVVLDECMHVFTCKNDIYLL